MNQEQIQPDYNYILQQQTPEPKKKSYRLPIVILLLLVGLTIAALVWVSLQSTKPVIKPNARSVTEQETKMTVSSYFQLVSDGQSEKAYAELSDSARAGLDKEQYERAVVERFPKVIKFSECVAESYRQLEQESTINYSCPTTSGQYIMVFEMGVIKQANNDIMINKSKLTVKKADT